MTESMGSVHQQVLSGCDIIEASGVVGLALTVEELKPDVLVRAVGTLYETFQGVKNEVLAAAGAADRAFHGPDVPGEGSARVGSDIVCLALKGSAQGPAFDMAGESLEEHLTAVTEQMDTARNKMRQIGGILTRLVELSDEVALMVAGLQSGPAAKASGAALWMIERGRAYVAETGGGSTQ